MPTPFVVHEVDFLDVLGSHPKLLRLSDTDAHEGPVWVDRDSALYFTSLPGPTHDSAIQQLRVDVDREPVTAGPVETVVAASGGANGMALGSDGRLLACLQGDRSRRAAIVAVGRRDGRCTTVVDNWNGLPLNSPNDVVQRGDGTIWFTDPSYGYLQGFRPVPLTGDHVYRYDPRTERLSVVADDIVKPNGLAFSPDEAVLYIADSGANQETGSFHPGLPHHVLAFDVVGGRHLANRRLLAVISPGIPDGLKVDSAGRVYVSAGDGVHVHSAAGDLLGEIRLPGAVNFCFGGPRADLLFITADTGIWVATLAATGATLRHAEPTAAATQGVIA